MSAYVRRQEYSGPRIGDAASLWNFAPAPGWTDEEVAIFKLCMQHYGVGSWQAIQRSGLLPGKLVQQLVGQAQRLLGQQSLAAFTGLQLDIDRIRQDNAQRTDVQRKAGLIIYTGPTATTELKEQWRKETQERYGLHAAAVREVAAELESLAAKRLDTVGGEGLQGAAARAGIHDVLGCDASKLPPALAMQLLRRLRTKLGVLVDRLRGKLGLPAAEKRSWEEVLLGRFTPDPELTNDIASEEGLDALGIEDATCNPAEMAPTAGMPAGLPPPARGRASGRGRGRGRGRGSASRTNKGCSLLRAAQGNNQRINNAAGIANSSAAGKRPGSKRKRAASGDSSDSEDLLGSTWQSAIAEAAYMEEEAGVAVLAGPSSRPAAQDSSRRRSNRKSAEQAAWEAAMAADIVSLQNMGFPAAKAKAALKETEGSVELALEWLLANCV